MIFFSVLIKKIKKRAEIIKNILPTTIAGMSVIIIGEIKETIPKTRVAVIIVPPIKSPRSNQSSLFLAAYMTKERSGRELPKLTIKIPTRVKGIFK